MRSWLDRFTDEEIADLALCLGVEDASVENLAANRARLAKRLRRQSVTVERAVRCSAANTSRTRRQPASSISAGSGRTPIPRSRRRRLFEAKRRPAKLPVAIRRSLREDLEQGAGAPGISVLRRT
jgi:hypothetical protein